MQTVVRTSVRLNVDIGGIRTSKKNDKWKGDERCKNGFFFFNPKNEEFYVFFVWKFGSTCSVENITVGGRVFPAPFFVFPETYFILLLTSPSRTVGRLLASPPPEWKMILSSSPTTTTVPGRRTEISFPLSQKTYTDGIDPPAGGGGSGGMPRK